MRNNIYKAIGLVLFLLVASHISAQTFKIMTLNVKEWETREPATTGFSTEAYSAVVKKHNPDISGFNENENRTSRMKDRDILIEVLSKSGMFSAFGYARDKGIAGQELYGNGLGSKYPILYMKSHRLPYDPKKSNDQRACIESVILVTSDDNPEGTPIRFMVLHLDHKIFIQRDQLDWIKKNVLDKGDYKDLPTLAVGDLNENAGGTFYYRGLNPFFQWSGDEKYTWTNTDKGQFHGTNKLDWLLIYTGLEPGSTDPSNPIYNPSLIYGFAKESDVFDWDKSTYEVDWTADISDHAPVTTVLKFKK